jgi:hypothetical protein
MKSTNNCPILIAILLLSLSSCIKEDYDLDKISSSVDTKSLVALPIASGSVSLEHVLPEKKDGYKYVYVDSVDLLHLVYKQNLDYVALSQYPQFVKDIQSSATVSAPPGMSFPINTEISGDESYTVTLSLDRTDQTIEEAVLKSGLLTIGSNASFGGTFSYIIESQDVVSSGNNYMKFSFNPTAEKQSTIINLAGYEIKPYSDNQIRFNIHYTVNKQKAGTTTDNINISLGLTNIRIEEFVGSLGQIVVPLQNTKFPINFSKMVEEGDGFDIKNPKVKLVFRGQGGVPLSFVHNGVKAIRDDQIYTITGLPSPINIYPPEYGVEKERVSEAEIDTNSNLVSILGKFPKTLDFDGYIIANPGYMPPLKNRLSINDTLYIGAVADFPLNLRLSNVVMRDTSSYDFSSIIKDSKTIDQLKLRFNVKNGFPFDIKLRPVIIDKSGNILDEVFEEPIVVKAATVQNGLVTNATLTNADASYDQIRIQKLKAGNRIIFISTINTVGNVSDQTVKFLASYRADIKIVGFMQVNLNKF